MYQLQTSVEGDNILIILIKHTYHFLMRKNIALSKCYKHLFNLYNSDANFYSANTPRVKVNHQNAQGHTALHYAISHAQRNHKTKLMTLLLGHGADCSLLDTTQQDFIFTQKRF